MKFTKNEIEKQTENAISFKIENQILWFQKKKLLISEDKERFEITPIVLEEAKKNFLEYKQKNDKKVIIKTNESIEDYNEKSFKIFLTLEIQDNEKREFTKASYISKSMLKENDIKDNEITLPLWLWNKIEEDLINDSVKYSNEKFNTNLTNRDYKVLNEVKIIE